MFILILDPARTGGTGPLEITPLPSNGRRENNSSPNPQCDSNGVLQESPDLGMRSADEHLPPIFRQAIALFQDSSEQQTFISGLFFGSQERRLAYIARSFSPEVAREVSEMKDLKRQQELEAVLTVGSIDPNPNGPLGQLLSMLGGLKFPESISAALGQISQLNQLAQYLLQVAARNGDKGPLTEYAKVIDGAAGSLSIPAVSRSDNNISLNEPTFVATSINSNDVVGNAIATADQTIARKNRAEQVQQKLVVLNEKIPSVQGDLKVRLQNERVDLKNTSIGTG